MTPAYKEGMRAFYAGKMRHGDNPYPVGSQDYREWDRGWYDAD